MGRSGFPGEPWSPISSGGVVRAIPRPGEREGAGSSSKSAEKGAGREGAREEGTQNRHAAKRAPPPAGRVRATAALGRVGPDQDVLNTVTPPRPLPSFTVTPSLP